MQNIRGRHEPNYANFKNYNKHKINIKIDVKQ